jgi:hypothetical protein
LKFEITITYGTSFAIDVVVCFRKFSATSNSSSNSLLLYSCSKNLISFAICACETSGSILIALVNQTSSALSFSIYSFLKALGFFSTPFLASRRSLSEALSLMALANMKKKMKTKKHNEECDSLLYYFM